VGYDSLASHPSCFQTAETLAGHANSFRVLEGEVLMTSTIMERKFKLITIISKIHGYIYLLSRGKFGTQLGSVPFLLLTTTGSKSGKKRTVPLTAILYGGHYILIASFGGSPSNPAWLTNIRHNPTVQVRVGTKIQNAEARIIKPTDPEYDTMWKKAVATSERYAIYQKATTRKIPIVMVTPHEV